MTANDNSPANRESLSDESFDYQSVGKTLLRGQLETRGYDVRDVFMELSQKVERGDDLDHGDIDELRAELNQARELVELIEEGLADE